MIRRRRREKSGLNGVLFPLLLVAGLQSGGVLAQSQSGYGPTSSLEGGDSVTEDIHQDDISTGALINFPSKPLQPWFEAKKRWNEKYGLKLNFSYQSLHMGSNNDTGLDEAAGARMELNGSWTLVGRGTKNEGRLTFRIEDRNTLGTSIPPSKLGNQFGSGTLVGTGFSEYDNVNLSELAWRQSLMDGRLRFVIGKISAVSWYGGHALSSPKRAFSNTALMSSNARAFPGRGFGAGMAYQFTPKFVALAGIHDANAKTTEDPFDTIGQGEFFKSMEMRWYLTTPERARWDQVRVNYWHQDAKKQAGVSESWGVNFVASKLIFDDKVMPFILAGYAEGDGALFHKDIAAGLSFAFDTTASKARDVLGMGIAWGEPMSNALQDQVTGEVFYRFQLLDNVAITPSVQIIKNPIANPEKTTVTVAGLRLRVTF